MSSQYGWRQQSKLLHYQNVYGSEMKGVQEKEPTMGVRGR